MRPRSRNPVLTVEAAQHEAAEIARTFGTFECDRCARAIAKKLGNHFDATFERLCTSDRSDVIGLANEGMQISTNRVHVGIRIGDKIIDSLHPEGVACAEWGIMFVSATEAPLVQQSVPIKDFFGKIFLVKKFNRWLYAF
jgi:hypothetical protein